MSNKGLWVLLVSIIFGLGIVGTGLIVSTKLEGRLKTLQTSLDSSEVQVLRMQEKLTEVIKQTKEERLIRYVDSISYHKVSYNQIKSLIREVQDEANINHIDENLVMAIISVESNWIGSNVMQVSDIHNTPLSSIDYGCSYLSGLMIDYEDTLSKALVAYNRGPAGMKKVKDLKKDSYYLKVMKEYKRLKQIDNGTI
jgi:hypothetical protein